MKKVTKYLLLITLFALMLNSTVPRLSSAKVLYSEKHPILISIGREDVSNLLIYNKVGNDSDKIVSSEIYVRLCYPTITQFKIRNTEEILLTTQTFTLNDTKFKVLNYDLIYDKSKTKVDAFFAIENLSSGMLEFFAKTSNDYGRTWSDFINVTSTSIEAKYFTWFDTAIFNDQIFFAFSWKELYIARFLYHTSLMHLNRDNLALDGEITVASTFLGNDFNFYTYNNRLYIAYTKDQQVILTYTTDEKTFSAGLTVNPPFGLDLATASNVSSTVLHDAKTLYPTVINWKGRFYVIAQDVSNTTKKSVKYYETFLWGFSVDDINKRDTLNKFNISSPVYDFFYEKTPSVSIYEDTLFLTFERGPSSLSSLQTPEVDFFFTEDATKWTGNYMGKTNFWFHPVTIFVAATLVIFIVALITNFVIYKVKKK